MKEIENELTSTETLLCQVHRHWIVTLLPALLGGLLLSASFLLGKTYLQISDEDWRAEALLLPILYSVFAVLLFWLAVRLRASPQLAITNQRIIIVSGIIYTQIFTVRITTVKDICVEQEQLGKIMGYANVRIKRQNATQLFFFQIKDADEFRRHILLLKYQLDHPGTPATHSAPQGREMIAVC